MTPLTVYFDGECPVCKFEVAFYQRRDKFHLITWTDITQIPDGQLPRGKSRPELLGKFHTVDQSGRWHIGVDAFHAIWQRLPWFSHFAPLFITPGIRQLSNVAYRLFLTWQGRDRRRRERRRRRLLQQQDQPDTTSRKQQLMQAKRAALHGGEEPDHR